MTAPAPKYASDAKVRKAARMARELGLDVAGLEYKPDGGIVILDRRALSGLNSGGDDGGFNFDHEQGDG